MASMKRSTARSVPASRIPFYIAQLPLTRARNLLWRYEIELLPNDIRIDWTRQHIANLEAELAAAMPPARGGQAGSTAAASDPHPGAEMHREYAQPCDVCGRRTSVRYSDGDSTVYRHVKCHETVANMPPARGGFDRTAIQAAGPGDIEEESAPADKDPQESGQVSGERYLTAGSIDPHTGIGRLPKVGRDYSSPGDAPRMYNGYEHPGPAPTALVMDAGKESFAERARRESEERYEALECKCAVCILCGPSYCPGDSETLRPMTTEQAGAARKALAIEGRQQKRRQELIEEQARQAREAGHDAKRIEKAVDLAGDGEALASAAAKYSTTTTECGCPDAVHGHGRKCKHQLAAIISANVERRIRQ